MGQPSEKPAAGTRGSRRRVARRHPRFAVSLPVRCKRLSGRAEDAWRGRATEVGGGGLAVDLPTRLAPGTHVAVEIRTGIGPMRMEADVLWTRRVAGRDGITRHGLCLADRSEVLDLPIHVLLGQWLGGLAKREGTKAARGGAQRRTRRRPKTHP
ncbi:MAG: PilZ domain-containing protein [candidate division NC10 bacterium]